MLLTFYLLIGDVFGLFAAFIAFGITWIEWQKHQFSGWPLWKEALKAGAVASSIVLLTSILLSYLVPAIVQTR